jgi:hypothetical protein
MACFGCAGSDSARVAPRRTDRAVRADRSGLSRFTIGVTNSSSAAVPGAGDSGRRFRRLAAASIGLSIHMSNDPTKNRQRVCQRSGKGPNRNCPDSVSGERRNRRLGTSGLGTSGHRDIGTSGLGTRDSGLGSDCFYSRGAFLGGRRLLPDVPMSRCPESRVPPNDSRLMTT